jgi:uncharacterized protein (TIGR03663 family)
LADESRSLDGATTLSRPLLAKLTIDWELAAYGGLVLFAIATRFWDLGSRALHHDESLHSLYSWYLYVGRGYVHDPMMHGPFQFEGTALIFLLFGASDYTARMLAAIFGVWIVISPYFLRRELGRLGALVASALFAVSPSFLYFSRFAREAIYFAGWELLVVIAIFGYLRTRQKSYLYLLALGTILAYATKETIFITGVIFLGFFVLETVASRLAGRSPVGWSALKSISLRDWGIMAAIFLGLYVVMYTTFFTNPKGIISGSWGAITYWLAQQGVQRGGQPWFYYLLLIPLYEFLPLLSALGGLVFLIVRRRLSRMSIFFWFNVVWFVGAFLIYSWAGEKMPWLDLPVLEPLTLLGAMSIAGLLRRIPLARFSGGPGLVALVLDGLVAVVLLGGLIAAPPLAGTQLGMQASELQGLAMLLLLAALVGALVMVGAKNGSAAALVPAGLGVMVALLVLTIHTGWGVAYARGDIPQDMLVYVQTSPDVPHVVQEINRISQQTGAGKDLKILLDGGYTENVGGQTISHESIAWPFEWYLRDYKNKSYYSKTFPTPTDAAVILAMVPNEEPIRASLSNYVAIRGRLNWWYPEDYKTLTWQKVWQGLLDPAVRAKLWRYFLYKETLNPLGSRDFDFFVRSDLATGIPLQPSTVAPSAAVPVEAQAQPSEATAQVAPGGITIFGKTATGASVLVQPRGVALGPNGLLYVVDSGASKLFAFRPDGTVAFQWGRRGTGDGEFNEPWGIAVAPTGEVYVADTWNHRIQMFDASGHFLGKWGSFADAKGQVGAQPGGFYGPRDVAIAANGNVLVTDTGNKRVQVFDPQGHFITMFGGDGVEPGEFKEPVGIAVDASGNIFVADTWNRRIQKLDPTGRPLAQFPVAGWESQSVANKPYLAIGPNGEILYTEPERHRFLVLDSSGRLLGSRGVLGSDPTALNLPIGIAVSPGGEIFVADQNNARVVKYQSWR